MLYLKGERGQEIKEAIFELNESFEKLKQNKRENKNTLASQVQETACTMKMALIRYQLKLYYRKIQEEEEEAILDKKTPNKGTEIKTLKIQKRIIMKRESGLKEQWVDGWQRRGGIKQKEGVEMMFRSDEIKKMEWVKKKERWKYYRGLQLEGGVTQKSFSFRDKG